MTVPTTPAVIAGRLLPADVSDAEFMRVTDQMQRDLAAQGVPDNLAQVGATPQPDGGWLVLSWRALFPWDSTFPVVANPQDYSFPATN